MDERYSSKMSRMRPTQLLLFLCLFVQEAFGQQPDSTTAKRDTLSPVTIDSTVTQKKDAKMGLNTQQSILFPDTSSVVKKQDNFFQRLFVKKYPNPRVAALLSFVLPGSGQAYNKKWWKIPIVYGALGGMTWLALDNDKTYRGLKKNYKWVVDGDDLTNPTEEPYIFMSPNQMKSYRDQFRGYTEKSYLFLGITYLLVVTDAFVDAHLSNFDVSDDLSLRIVPDIQSGSSAIGASFGIGIRLGFGNTSAVRIPAGNVFVNP